MRNPDPNRLLVICISIENKVTWRLRAQSVFQVILIGQKKVSMRWTHEHSFLISIAIMWLAIFQRHGAAVGCRNPNRFLFLNKSANCLGVGPWDFHVTGPTHDYHVIRLWSVSNYTDVPKKCCLSSWNRKVPVSSGLWKRTPAKLTADRFQCLFFETGTLKFLWN